jgi:DNA-binding GntR family transcriptional regulator
VQSRPAALLDEHEVIVEAIARDPDQAKSAARVNVQNAFAARLTLYADQ